MEKLLANKNLNLAYVVDKVLAEHPDTALYGAWVRGIATNCYTSGDIPHFITENELLPYIVGMLIRTRVGFSRRTRDRPEVNDIVMSVISTHLDGDEQECEDDGYGYLTKEELSSVCDIASGKNTVALNSLIPCVPSLANTVWAIRVHDAYSIKDKIFPYTIYVHVVANGIKQYINSLIEIDSLSLEVDKNYIINGSISGNAVEDMSKMIINEKVIPAGSSYVYRDLRQQGWAFTHENNQVVANDLTNAILKFKYTNDLISATIPGLVPGYQTITLATTNASS